jgi:hypothetical protein
MSFVPTPCWGRLDITLKADGRFGMADPLQWPQIYVRHARMSWLPCVPQKSHPRRRPETWAPLTDQDFVPCKSVLRALYVVKQARLKKLQEALDELLAEVDAFENTKSHSQQLRWLQISSHHAYQRLVLPATKRDLVLQYVTVERYYCMAVAWLTSDNLLSNLHTALARPVVRLDLMGCFTTEAGVVQICFDAGIPVWYMRLADTLGAGDIIVSRVDMQPPSGIVLAEGEYSNDPVYRGPPGLRHMDIVCFRGSLYIDLEPVPYPADYTPDNDPSSSKQPAVTAPQLPSSSSTSQSGPLRSVKSSQSRSSPCK